MDAAERQQAGSATLTAYYTPRWLIGQLWQAIADMGFTGGTVLEPGAGSGQFFGMMPDEIRDKSTFIAVEKDPVSAQVLSLLYPGVVVHAQGLETVSIDPGTVDLVVGNVPFGQFSVFDKARPFLSRQRIHNYFIGRSIEALREGGLAVLLTSTGTLDNAQTEFREWLVERGVKLIRAVRLPAGALAEANTEVCTDVLFLHKDSRSTHQTPYVRTETILTRPVLDGDTITGQQQLAVNTYFGRFPGQLIGDMNWADAVGKGGLYRADQPTCYHPTPTDISPQVQTALSDLPRLFYPHQSDRTGTMVIGSDKRADGFTGSVKINGRTYTQARIIAAYKTLKTTYNTLLRDEREDTPAVEESRVLCREAYTEFSRFFGTLNQNRAVNFLDQYDRQFAFVQSLEIREGTTNIYKPSQILTGRVKQPIGIPDRLQSIDDAVSWSEAVYNRLNLSAMASWLGCSTNTVAARLRAEGAGFDTGITDQAQPDQPVWQSRETYLSGNVVAKLRQVQDVATTEADDRGRPDVARPDRTRLIVARPDRYAANIAALQAVQPQRVPLTLISFGLGSTWLPEPIAQEFTRQTLAMPTVSVSFNTRAQLFIITNNNDEYSPQNRSLGGGNRTAIQLIEAGLNNRTIEITRIVPGPDGKPRTVRDVEATAAAIAALEYLNELFDTFGREHYAASIEDSYNDCFNNHRPRTYRSSPLVHLPGANPAITLYDHQRRAIERSKQQNTLLAHSVGTGKTYTMISSVMEMIRLGRVRKALISVQNSTLTDFTSAFRRLYPAAVVYSPTPAELAGAANRKRFLQRIAANCFDAVIIPQSMLRLIPDSPAIVESFVQEEVEQVEAMIALSEQDGKIINAPSGKRYMKRLNELKLRVAAQRLEQASRTVDSMLNFDELGVDMLCLDECHKFKRLGFRTNRRNVKGIDTEGSQEALSALCKIRAITDIGGRVILATGTPISNTMAEVHTMIRYIAPEVLSQYKITTFDAFAGCFGQIVPSFELTTSGQFKAVERFAKFVNVRQLIDIYRQHVDIILTDDISEFARDNKIPKLVNGAFSRIIIPQTEGVQVELTRIREKLAWFEGLEGGQKRENCHVPLVLFGQARRSTLDVRLLDRAGYNEPHNKLGAAAGEITRLYRQSGDYNGTQLVFADLYQSPATEDELYPEDGRMKYRSVKATQADRFNLFDELKTRLIAGGIPASEIVICPAEMKDREAVFVHLRTGAVRVMLGTTDRMGVGVNVQERLVALHHLDAPYRPTDFEQRNGRILRQGNRHAEWNIPVEVITYGVEKTLDATAYGRLALKQKFINQVLKGEMSDATMTDISAEDDFASLSFQEMMATLSGSQYALAYAAKKLAVSRLISQRKTWQRQVREAATQVRFSGELIADYTAVLTRIESVHAQVQAAFKQTGIVRIQVDNQPEITEQFGEAIQAVLARFTIATKQHREASAYVTVNGVGFWLKSQVYFNTENRKITVAAFWLDETGTDAEPHKPILSGDFQVGTGFAISLRAAINRLLSKPTDIANAIAYHSGMIAEFSPRINQPFAKAQELATLESELIDLEAAMMNEANPDKPVPTGQPHEATEIVCLS